MTTRKWLVGVIALGVVAVGVPAPAYGQEGNGAGIPDASAALNGTFQTQDGSPVQIFSDDRNQGERVVVGRMSNGDVVRYLVQSTSITEADREAIRRDLAEPKEPQKTAAYDDQPSGVETFEVSASPLSPDLIWEPVSVVATTSSDASIAWTVSDFTAKVSKVGAEQSRGGEVVLESLEPGSVYAAELEAVDTEIVDERIAARIRSIEFQTLPEEVEQDAIAPLTYQNWTTAYVHKTFIPDATVAALYCGNWPTYTFGGDNRSYRTPSFATPNETPDYRTSMFGNVNWDNPAPYDFIWTRAVGASKIYNNGLLQQTLYASTADMLVKEISAGTSYARAYFDHTATNPQCKFLDVNYGGAIRYAEWVEYYRSGTVAVDGYRFKAPAHEMYGRFNTSSGSDVWITISRRQNDGFVCLLGNGACGLDFYQPSASF